ncbi:MAG: hypothetical protein ABIR96_04580 [Bdellovibrionota bacterium]
MKASRQTLSLALGFLVIVASYVVVRWEGRQPFPDGCDSFGYMRLAQILREAVSSGHAPDYTIHHPQIDALRTAFAASSFPVAEWSEALAPQAHHDNPARGTIGIQYPPGTGLVLAPFSPERAPVRYSQSLVILLFLFGAGVLLIFYRRGKTEAALPLVFAAASTMILCDTVKHYSYSIQASIPFLIVGLVLLARSRDSKKARDVIVAAFALSLACLCRLPIVFHFVGWFLLAAPSLRWIFAGAFGVIFGAATLLYNWHVTGNPFTPTYGPIDNAAPSLSTIGTNLSYYFVGGGNQFVWAVIVMTLIAIPALAKSGRWKNGVLPLVALIGVPLGYFLTHAIHWSYYMHPTWLSAVWVLALAASIDLPKFSKRFATGIVVLGSVVILTALPLGKWTSHESHRTSSISESLIPTLHDDRAWIWSDFSSGSFWYYWKKPSQKMNFASPELQIWTEAWIRSRGDTLYIVEDSDSMKRARQRLEEQGISFEEAGKALGYPVYRARR